MTRSHWEKASLAEVLRAVVTGCRSNAEQFAIDGPELGGRVEVSWHLSGDEVQPVVRLTWREQDGPAVVPPARHGFGLMMIEKALAYELGGAAGVDFRPGGIVCNIEIALVPRLQPRL